MVEVRTFTSEIKVFHTMNELAELDGQVNRFLEREGIKKVVSVSDTTTADNSGATIGIIRVVAFER